MQLDETSAFTSVQVMVRDVNDNAPTFTTPTYLKVHHKNLTSFVSHFTLTDADDWELGHGPPFSAYMDPRTPESIAKAVAVTYRPSKYFKISKQVVSSSDLYNAI